MNNKKVALLLTVYKNDTYQDFVEAINSIYNQTYSDIDIFIQEDGPVEKKIHSFLMKELEGKRIFNLGLRKKNKGFDYSLNELLEKAFMSNYQYIARMDADDVSTPNRIKNQIQFMNKNPNVDVCGTDIEEFGSDMIYSKIVRYPHDHESLYNFFSKRVPIAHVTSFFRKSFFEKAGLYETKGHINNGDTLLWMKGFKSNCIFANLNFIGVKVRVNKNFFSRRTGFKKAYCDLRNRLEVIKNLDYSPTAYFYAILIFCVNLAPSNIKKFLYLRLR